MKRKRSKRLLLVLIIALVLIISSILYFQLNGKVSLSPPGLIFSKDSCLASVGETKINLGLMFSKNKITEKECWSFLTNKKDSILEALCMNTDSLGEVIINWDSKQIGTFPLECEESLSEEDIPITVTGELKQYVLDDFDHDYSEDVQKIRNIKNDEILDLDIKGKKIISSERGLEPGDIIQIRGKKVGNKILLDNDDSSRIKLVSKGEKIK